MVPVLVTGGAGFVGSHACKALAAAGFLPVVYDDLSNGSTAAVRWGPLVVGDILDGARLRAALASWRPAAVMHFAAFIEAGESVRRPLDFYRNNVAGAVSVAEAMVASGVGHLVFSSTAAVYGEPRQVPIPERHPLRPTSPYGRSKLMVEEILRDAVAAHGLRLAVLRYFNAAGADPEGDLGEGHDPETHLVPLAVQTALGLRGPLVLYGTDYPTADGTCVRDYVHVSDLAAAHVLILRRLLLGDGREAGEVPTYNVGTGRGHSVREVVATVAAVTGRRVAVREAPRRPGDPAVLVAAADRLRDDLGWRPQWPALADQVRHCLQWTTGRAAVAQPATASDGRVP